MARLLTLCPACREHARRWTEYTPPRLPRIASGAARDDTLPGLHDRAAARVADRRALVASQLRILANICAAQHGKEERHAAPGAQ